MLYFFCTATFSPFLANYPSIFPKKWTSLGPSP